MYMYHWNPSPPAGRTPLSPGTFRPLAHDMLRDKKTDQVLSKTSDRGSRQSQPKIRGNSAKYCKNWWFWLFLYVFHPKSTYFLRIRRLPRWEYLLSTRPVFALQRRCTRTCSLNTLFRSRLEFRKGQRRSATENRETGWRWYLEEARQADRDTWIPVFLCNIGGIYESST